MGPRFRGDDRWRNDRWVRFAKTTLGSFRQNAPRSRIPGAAQHEVVRCRPGAVPVCGGPGSAMHRVAGARAASHPGHTIRTIPVFSCFSADSESSIPGLTISRTHTPPPSRGAFLRPGFFPLLHSPRIEGWAERRETFGCCAKHPLGVPSCVKDARERAYDVARQAPSEAPCVP
jgi:hypothetical protein